MMHKLRNFTGRFDSSETCFIGIQQCECGILFTAVSSTEDNCKKLIRHKHRKHWLQVDKEANGGSEISQNRPN